MFRKKGKSKTFSADLQLLLPLKKYPTRKINATLLIFKFTWGLISIEITLDFCNIYIFKRSYFDEFMATTCTAEGTELCNWVISSISIHVVGKGQITNYTYFLEQAAVLILITFGQGNSSTFDLQG